MATHPPGGHQAVSLFIAGVVLFIASNTMLAFSAILMMEAKRLNEETHRGVQYINRRDQEFHAHYEQVKEQLGLTDPFNPPREDD